MRKLLFLLFLATMLSCQQDNLEDFPVLIEPCAYNPSPCDLIPIEKYIEISGSTPFPDSESYVVDDFPEGRTKNCEFAFEDIDTNEYSAVAKLRCVIDIENTEFTNLSEATDFSGTDQFSSDDTFPIAIYFPDVEVYVIRKENYILEIDFNQFTKEQQIEIATIMLDNLP